MFKKTLLIMLLMVFCVFSYSFTAFPPITGKGNFAINPVIFADKKNSGGGELFLYCGLTNKWDICSSILSSNGSSSVATMVRYDAGKGLMGILRGNASWILPQLNYCWENDRLFVQASASSQITYDYSDRPALFGLICPGYKFNNWLSFCCEVNPGYYMQDGDFANCSIREKGFGYDIVPSLGLQIGDCTFSIALPIYKDEDIFKIRKLYAQGVSYKKLMQDFGIKAHGHFYRIIHRKNWKHL
jgi:hypothetical protein